MIFTLYSAEDGGYRGRLGGRDTFKLDHERLERSKLIAIKGRREPATYLDLGSRRVRKLKTLKPVVTEGGISRLPAGTQLVRDHTPLDTIEAAGGASIGAQYVEDAEIELRHPHYHRATVTVPCGGKRAKAGKRIDLPQDRDDLRARAYPHLREQIGAFQKIIKALLPLLSPEQLAEIDPDALAVLAQPDAVKAKFPKSDPKE